MYPLYLVYFIQHNFFKNHLCCNMCQNFMSQRIFLVRITKIGYRSHMEVKEEYEKKMFNSESRQSIVSFMSLGNK